MKTSRKPAMNRKGAWLTKNRGTAARHFGSVPVDRVYLEEQSFGLAGKLKIYTDFDWESVENYRRSLDAENGILRVNFTWRGHAIEMTAFASVKEEVLYYEVAADTTCLNLNVVFEPSERQAYRNYNLGGFYFEEEKKRNLLIGKGELKADGFPKADENGIHVKNASRAALRIYLKSARRKRA